jgi:gliding motility-associated-like protein
MKQLLLLSILLHLSWYLCTAQSCNNWLSTPSINSVVNIGDLDVPGDQITVEATINSLSAIDGDIVTKHNTPADVNYLLRPNDASITTTNGFFLTPAICGFELNKTYHVAMVYNGSILKFYRNGFLMSQVAATGNLFQNNWNTRFGYYDPAFWNSQFTGYINEVRIWNVARTQNQIQTYMNSSLPAPTTQPGLLANYTFDNLLNKQGNATYNGTLGGAASINATNPNCTFVADSCGKVAIDSLIINTYTPVTALNPCDNKITVEDASTFNIGDTVLIIQMKGAVIDTSNTTAFGNITSYKNAGNYEFNYVKSKAGNVIELKDSLTRAYDIPTGKVQLIRIPYYNSASLTSVLTCLPWDGSKGGVLVLNAKNAVTLQADINLTAKGFHGGNSHNYHSNTLYCFENNYYYPAGSVTAASKGESITSLSDNISWGKGAAGNGGGGGLGHNSGGGGGANGGAGGFGGYQLDVCGNAPFDNRGIGANILLYSTVQNKIFLGGGGGSGHTDQIHGSDMQGGNGGGIIIINTPNLNANGFNIIANGGDAPQCLSAGTTDCHDGGGGGGGGGVILINTNNYIASTQLVATGGKGADLSVYDPSLGANRIGPGGGGGAGVTWLNNSSLPAVVLNNLTGGINGLILADNNNPWGTTSGKTGNNLFNLALPFDTKPFKKNIDSVRIKIASTSCNAFAFTGLAYVQKNPVKTWYWDFGDGVTANTTVVKHPFAAAGIHTISLIITDSNGCIDSIKTSVTTTGSTIDFSYKQDACNTLSVQFTGVGNAPVNPSWVFGDGNLAPGVSTTHTYAVTGNYTVQYSVQNGGCSDTITKTISVNILRQDIILTHDTTICFGTTKQLLTAPSLNFCWSPTTYLNDPTLANPTTNSPVPITYFFTAEIPDSNIITNGDFGAGNTGFTSQYNFANPNVTEGQYFVGPNPPNWNASLSSCGDHTTGNGNMMLVDGALVPDILVWKQTVSVLPNTNYAFSTWMQALYTPNPTELRFSINGGNVGNLITAALSTCTWTQFYTTWNSGNSTIATIAIVNKNTIVQRNDFALDDISFSPVLIKRDSVIITVDQLFVKANNDTVICAGKSVQLTATGGITYNWSPSTGLTNAGIANPVATPPASNQYTVTGTDGKGCTAADTVSISTKALPVVTITADTTICKTRTVQLRATGGANYQWVPAAGLSNASIANPVASPVNTTRYSVIVTGTNSCSAADSVNISISPEPVFTISPADTTCLNTTAQLMATGGDVYTWSPASLVSNANIANPVTNNNNNAVYTVVIKELTCNNTTTLTTTVAVLAAPAIKASKSNDIDCSFAAAQLQTTGAGQFSWSPAGALNNSAVANPMASPTVTTLYTVHAVDFTTNCTATDTITVFVNKGGSSSFYIPSAFTPNGDGINDCFKVSHFNFIKSVDISIYNRYGSLVFHTTTDNVCWDGTYRGKDADPGNYVYYIKAEDNCNKFYKKGNLLLIR